MRKIYYDALTDEEIEHMSYQFVQRQLELLGSLDLQYSIAQKYITCSSHKNKLTSINNTLLALNCHSNTRFKTCLLNTQQKLIDEKQKTYHLSQYEDKIAERMFIIYEKETDIIYDHLGKISSQVPSFPLMQKFDRNEREVDVIGRNIEQLREARRRLNKFGGLLQGKNGSQINEKCVIDQRKCLNPQETKLASLHTIQATIQAHNSKKKQSNISQVNENQHILDFRGNSFMNNPQYLIYNIYTLLENEQELFEKMTTEYGNIMKKMEQINTEKDNLVREYKKIKGRD